MKSLALLFALALVSCASLPRAAHTSEFVDIVLSPAQPTNTAWQLTLVSVSHSGRVRVRGPHGSNGDVYSAHLGERFHIGDGASLDCTLKSVDLRTGTVTITGEMRLYH